MEEALAEELAELVTVESVEARENGVEVTFRNDSVPSSFTEEMLSRGFAVESVDGDGDVTATFTSVTSF